MTELQANNGRWIRNLAAPSFGFGYPNSFAFSSSTLWVTNSSSNAIDEIDANSGALIERYAGSHYDLYSPVALSVFGRSLWVVNGHGDSLVHFNQAPFTAIKVVSAVKGRFNVPVALSIGENHVWVANSFSYGLGMWSSVSELDARTGALVRIVGGSKYRIYEPTDVVSDGSHVWVASFGRGSEITGFDASSGRIIRVLVGRISLSGGILIEHGHLWIADNANDRLLELNASNGQVQREFSGTL